jgi:N-acetylglutamate synthase-like GNAT family acetyltransferase
MNGSMVKTSSDHAAKRRLEICLVPFTSGDRSQVTGLLRDVPALYPNGARWLERRLDDALDGKARVMLARAGSNAVGVTIETPKGKNRIKLSTILVDENARGYGVGSRLLASCIDSWNQSGIEEAIVTARVSRAPQLTPLLSRLGFHCISVLPNRYGELNDEAVFRWTPDSHSSACPHGNEDTFCRSNLLRT